MICHPGMTWWLQAISARMGEQWGQARWAALGVGISISGITRCAKPHSQPIRGWFVPCISSDLGIGFAALVGKTHAISPLLLFASPMYYSVKSSSHTSFPEKMKSDSKLGNLFRQHFARAWSWMSPIPRTWRKLWRCRNPMENPVVSGLQHFYIFRGGAIIFLSSLLIPVVPHKAVAEVSKIGNL